MKKIGSFITLVFFLSTQFGSLSAQNARVKDFRSSNQKAALLGVASEFVEGTLEDRIVEQMRRLVNRYTRSFGGSTVAGFNLGANQGKKFFKPVLPDVPFDEAQKKFLQAAGKDNSFEIVVLGYLRDDGGEISSDLQLYDVRTDTRSPIVSAKFQTKDMTAVLEKQVYTLMNHMDREGFVGATAQNFLEPPAALSNESGLGGAGNFPSESELAVNPTELGQGYLAGSTTVGGEKTPFWETWWFWTSIAAGLALAGGLTYYFVVVDQPKSGANVGFNLP